MNPIRDAAVHRLLTHPLATLAGKLGWVAELNFTNNRSRQSEMSMRARSFLAIKTQRAGRVRYAQKGREELTWRPHALAPHIRHGRVWGCCESIPAVVSHASTSDTGIEHSCLFFVCPV